MDSDGLRQERIELWAQVRAVFASADELFREAKRWVANDDGEVKGPPTSYVKQRQALRVTLTGALKATLEAQLGELQAGHCLVPLVIALDERERLCLGALAKRWGLPRLQTEILGIDDGGDRFYDELDARFDAGGMHPLVFELYLLCLKWGFEGRYKDRPTERQGYVNRLVERVRRDDPRRTLATLPGAHLEDAPEPELPPDGRRRKVSFVSFPYQYYVGVGVAAFLLMVVLRVHSRVVVKESPIGCACVASIDQRAADCAEANGR